MRSLIRLARRAGIIPEATVASAPDGGEREVVYCVVRTDWNGLGSTMERHILYSASKGYVEDYIKEEEKENADIIDTMNGFSLHIIEIKDKDIIDGKIVRIGSAVENPYG